jgi:hypothetical protein
LTITRSRIHRAVLKNRTGMRQWRWRIGTTNRLTRFTAISIHGTSCSTGTDFTLLDRSRGEWGEPADDTSCLSTNYLFSSLLRTGRLEGPFEKMFLLFWDNYLEKTNDREMLEVAAPFFAWRGLVIASPVWYPHLPAGIRKKIFNFIQNVLSAEQFNPGDVNRYLQ